MNKVIDMIKSNLDFSDFITNTFAEQEQIFFKYAKEENEINFFENYEQFNLMQDFTLDDYYWQNLCKDYTLPWTEEAIDKHVTRFHKFHWMYISANPNIKWNERLINKYFDNLWLGQLIKSSNISWDEKLIRLVINKVDDKTKIFLLTEAFSEIKNISWNIQMLLDFPFSYWIERVVTTGTLRINFEEIKNYKISIPENIFRYIQKSEDLTWTANEIDEFSGLLDFKILSMQTNVIWTDTLILENKDRLNFEKLSANQSIKISDETLLILTEYWDYYFLSYNPAIKWNLNLIKRLLHKIDLTKILQFEIEGITADFIEKHKNIIRWNNKAINYRSGFGGEYNAHWHCIAAFHHIPISVKTLKENTKVWLTDRQLYNLEVNGGKSYAKFTADWRYFSNNHFLTEEHLVEFQTFMAWDVLSANERIMLNEQILNKFKDHWEWDVIIRRKDFTIAIFTIIHIYLSYDFLNKHKDRIYQILESEKNILYTYLKNIKYNSFLYGLHNSFRTPFALSSVVKDATWLDDQTIFCAEAMDKLKNLKILNLNDEIIDYMLLQKWLRDNHELFNIISYVNETLDRYSSAPNIDKYASINNFCHAYICLSDDYITYHNNVRNKNLKRELIINPKHQLSSTNNSEYHQIVPKFIIKIIGS